MHLQSLISKICRNSSEMDDFILFFLFKIQANDDKAFVGDIILNKALSLNQ